MIYGLVLAATTCFAAYHGWRFFGGSGGQSVAQPRFPSVRRGRDGTIGPPASAPARGPGEMTGNPLAGVGMKPMDEDPGRFAPPEGAVRDWAFVRQADETEMMAQYSWTGSSDRAAEYYREYLAEKGMEFLGERRKGTPTTSSRPANSRYVRPRRVLVFHADGRHMSITLRQMRNDEKVLVITVHLIGPGK